MQISVKRVYNNATLPYFRVELPEPRVVFVLVDAFGEMIGMNEIPIEYRGEVQRLIAATTEKKV